jgi:hypothetical protein
VGLRELRLNTLLLLSGPHYCHVLSCLALFQVICKHVQVDFYTHILFVLLCEVYRAGTYFNRAKRVLCGLFSQN